MSQYFSAVIYKYGINPCVDVPADVSRSFGRSGYIPVRVQVGGAEFRSTLVPTGQGAYRLYINGAMRKQAQAGVGDEVQIGVEIDEGPRAPEMPVEFARALAQHPAAKRAFEQLTPSRRKDILAYMNALKQPASLQRTIDRIIGELDEES